MASTIRIELNEEGINELLRGPEVRADLLARAQRIAVAAASNANATGTPAEFMVETNDTGERARAVVITGDAAAMIAEAKDRALTRALDAGR